ncbi:hypothetical protein C8R44DRAFT_542311, partial [Mycena epipterygia]
DVRILVCKCAPAAEQLLRAGLFPSTPWHPTLAVDARVLQLVMGLVVRIVPNNTAWSATLETFLEGLGFTLTNEGCLRQLFVSCLEWYTHLRHRRHRDPTPEATSNPFDDPPPRTRPSDYLCRQCPACFGDLTHDPAVVYVHRPPTFFACVDACFTQRRNKGPHDPPKAHPNTHFIPEDLSAKMEEYVDGVRDTRPGGKRRKATVVAVEEEEDPDDFEHPKLRLPCSVLNGCESSFKAADERRQKASTQFYDNTALMALLCRHDRVLWLVNMHSTREKQFYVLLLMEMMFQHLPLDIVIGFLYDVACQLKCSAWKWNFLGRYMDRLAFAVTVFHAFGHEWSCQIIYHPRKREGFGFTNGEGCERLWHSISHLIAHLRISSVCDIYFMSNNAVQHADEANLFKLAEWIHRQALFSKAKRMEAELELTESGHAVPFLRAQWAAQVKAQTKPLPHMSCGSCFEMVLTYGCRSIEDSGTADRSRPAVLNAIDTENADAIVHTKVALESTRKALFKVKEQLARKELALGVADRSELKKLAKSKYMELCMNAQAVKMRLRDRLRKRKFERDRIERSSRRQQTYSEQKLLNHTESAIKRREPQISHLRADYN